MQQTNRRILQGLRNGSRDWGRPGAVEGKSLGRGKRTAALSRRRSQRSHVDCAQQHAAALLGTAATRETRKGAWETADWGKETGHRGEKGEWPVPELEAESFCRVLCRLAEGKPRAVWEEI
jgi:hypothetical protein